MICVRCGRQIPDNSKFCEYCGTQQPGQAGGMAAGPSDRPAGGMAAGQSNLPAGGMTTGQMQALQLRRNQQKKKATVFAAIGAVILLCVAAFFHFYKKTVNLADYVTVQYQGYDSFGTAEIAFDFEKFYGDLQKKAKNLKVSKNGNEIDSLEDILDGISDFGAYSEICSGLDWKLDKSENLSNGDTVSVSFSFDNEKAKKYGIKYIGKTEKYTVEGLEEVTAIDPFQDVSLEFSGTSPNVSASVQNNSSNEAIQSLNFSVSPSSGIQKGDTVTVAVEDDEQSLLQEYGCKLLSVSKEFACDNVDAYITALSEVDRKILSSMKSQTRDVINSYFADNRRSVRKSNLKYSGCYFLYRKDDGWDGTNIIYVVFEGRVRSRDKSFKAKDVYFPVKFENIIQYADGSEDTDLNSTSIEGTTSLSFGWWNHVPGYTSKRDMYSELVASRKGEYRTEEFGKLK